MKRDENNRHCSGSREAGPDPLSPELARLIRQRDLPSPSEGATRRILSLARQNLRDERNAQAAAPARDIRMRHFIKWGLAVAASVVLMAGLWKLSSRRPIEDHAGITAPDRLTSVEIASLEERLAVTLARSRDRRFAMRSYMHPRCRKTFTLSRRLKHLRARTEWLRERVEEAVLKEV